MTIQETYYDINTRLNTYLETNGISCPIYKYGIDPANLKPNKNDLSIIKYPYMQSFINNVNQQSRTSAKSGIYTKYDFQISFFTSPENEYENDAKLFYPFEVIKNALSDVQLNILGKRASILKTIGGNDFNMKSGQPIPSAFVIYRMVSVCSYSATILQPGESTNIDSAITIGV